MNEIISFQALRKIRYILLLILDLLRINDFFRLINRKRMIILMYHGISKRDFTYNHKRYLPKSLFLKEIKYLKKKKYKFITLTEWLEIVKNKKKIKNKYITLTFDDGFKNVIENAYTIMKQYQAKGCFYVVSGIIGNNQLIWADYIDVLVRNHESSKFKFKFKNQEIEYNLSSESEVKKAVNDMKNKIRTLSYEEKSINLEQFNFSNNTNNFQKVPTDYLIASWEDIRSLDRKVLEIGCHTKTHPKLEILSSEDQFYEELYQSKLELEKKIGYPIMHLCYPAGSYNKNVIYFTKKYGYATGVIINNGFNTLMTDLFQLKRVNLENDFLLFKYNISGFYDFLIRRFNMAP